MKETAETIQAAIDDLKRQTAAVEARVAAFEKARVEEEEPPVCSETLLAFLERGCESLGGSDYQKAAAEIRHLRGELARLREGLRVQFDDLPADRITPWTASELQPTEGGRMAREIQRHRKLVAK